VWAVAVGLVVLAAAIYRQVGRFDSLDSEQAWYNQGVALMALSQRPDDPIAIQGVSSARAGGFAR
jgi:hypothetical protein